MGQASGEAIWAAIHVSASAQSRNTSIVILVDFARAAYVQALP